MRDRDIRIFEFLLDIGELCKKNNNLCIDKILTATIKKQKREGLRSKDK